MIQLDDRIVGALLPV